MRRFLGVSIPVVLALMVAATAVAQLPPGGTFVDDDGNIHEPNIEAIAAAGITKGCNPPANDRYCPDDPVTRAQMAAFLLRGMGEAGGPPPYQGVFADVPAGLWYTGYAEWLHQLAITKGCAVDPLRYCPNRPVSRAEMAVFIVRAIGEDENLPAYQGYFSDVPPGLWYTGYAERLYQLGITVGCATDKYCPNDPITRDQMATFLARTFKLTPINPPPTTSPTVPGGSISFAAGGDIGANSRTSATLDSIADSGAAFFLALGDLSYGDASPSEWCKYVKGHLGTATPVQIVVGNHEDDDRVDGYIGDFAACLPDQMNSVGTFAAEYYFDVDGLVRVIMIGAGNDVAGERYDYPAGSAHYKWLEGAIDNARAQGIPWVIVGMHKVCITAGEKSCEIGPDVLDLLIDKRVDLVLHGHDHNYQRSKQVTCAVANSYRSSCVVDSGADDSYAKGVGTVWLVAGATGGGSLYDINPGDSEIGYLAAWMGGNHPQAGRGYLDISVSSNTLTVDFIGTTTSFTDSFSIKR